MTNWSSNREMEREEYERWRKHGHERGWLDRIGDEVRSWFGDDEAERRRRMDMSNRQQRWGSDYDRERSSRNWEEHPEFGGRQDVGFNRERGMSSSSYPYGRSDYGTERYGRDQEGRFGRQSGFGQSQSDFGRGSTMSSDWTNRGSIYGYGGSMYGGQEQNRMTGSFFGQDDYARQSEFGTFGGGRSPQWQGQGMGSSFGSISHQGRGPRNYQRSDERIKDDIHERLTRHHEIDATEIEVIVDKGEVTLQGVVDHRYTKRLAEDIAEDIFGVKQVHNQIRVQGRDQSLLTGQRLGENADDKSARQVTTRR
jgi:osmotically-inducible protein OsmY